MEERNKERTTSEEQGIYEALSAYVKSDYYPYHMPGHKRSPQAGAMADFYGIDITEIDGFDNLHHAEGLIQDAQARANQFYGAEETFYLINGSTVGILAVMMAVAQSGEELLVARNCHKAVYHGAILQGLKLHYYYPEVIREYDIYDGVEASGIELLLEKYPACKAVIITSPTYEGILSDVAGIARVVHEKGKILIVDEAHGAHLKLTEKEPVDAIAAGADLVIHSLHKTLPAMTQTALLHVQGERVDRYHLRKYLAMLQTSSPSYVLMASMDSCMRFVEEQGAVLAERMRAQYEIFRREVEGCKHIRVGNIEELTGKSYALRSWDWGKLVLSVKGTGISGQQLYEWLRETYHLQLEMAAGSYALAMMTIMDREEGWKRLAAALRQMDAMIGKGTLDKAISITQFRQKDSEKEWEKPVRPKACLIPEEAFQAAKERVLLTEAEGRIAADFVNLYPPGIPLLVPGEQILKELVTQIKESIAMGLTVQGLSPQGEILVIK